MKEAIQTKQKQKVITSLDVESNDNAQSNCSYVLNDNPKEHSSYSFTDTVLNPSYVLGYN